MAAVHKRSKEETKQLLEHLKQNLKDAKDIINNKVKCEDVAIFVGNTKSGKSTTINYLIGNPLVARKDTNTEHVKKFNPLRIYKASDAEGPEIGSDSTSKTTEPSRWVASEIFSGLVLYDCPGFCDNRGPVQAITNAYYIYHIFQRVKSVKMVLVVDDINDIVKDKINSFLSLLTSVENIFRDKIELCFSSFVIIFTKVPPTIEDVPTDIDYLKEILESQCLLSKSLDISKYSKKLVQYFIDHPENIAVIKKANEGAISNDIEINLVQAIRDTSRVPEGLLKQFSFPSIDSNSKVFLYEIKNELASKETFEEVIKVIQNVFNDILTKFDKKRQDSNLTKEQVIKEKEKLCSLQEKIARANVAIDIFTKLQALKEIDPEIKTIINNSEIENIMGLMNFIDGLLKTAESELCNISLKCIMEHVCLQMSKYIMEMKIYLKEIKMEVAREKMENDRVKYEKKIEEMVKQYQKALEQNANVSKSLGFFASIGNALDNLICGISDGIRVLLHL